ncbi:cytochrome P450 [Acidocella aquatica]|uniref:Cytochrome P450 n=1 Tax=Acidocella aquatica TaxID=1922313 RepID=A0ABQ6A0Z9_9PROT|nr:cytochrome P450 [Acidocella aquatica]GLR66111.1 cytochrome P450 [Acidocella aquatica]
MDTVMQNSGLLDIPLDRLDVSQHHLFRTGEVLPLFARLRREDPVHYCAQSQNGPYWSVTKHEDIMKVDTNPKVFSSSWENGGIVLDDAQAIPPVKDFVISAFIALDEPRHGVYRRAVQPIVSADSLRSLEDLVRTRTKKVLDSLPRDQVFNWVDLVSIELTTLLLATLFDVPVEDRHLLREWSDVTATLEGMDGFIGHENRIAKLTECLHYFMKLWNDRVNAPPKFDLVSMLAHDPNTRNMTPIDYLSQILVLIVGGNDTTRNTMSATINAINLFPDEYRKVREDRKLIPAMVDEIIRWQTPIPHMRRTALEDFQLRGKLIRKGDKVAMWYYSGNRDEEVFPDGDSVNVNRPNVSRQLSFGFGIHRCMGMNIAKLQLRILWEEMLDRFEFIEMLKPPVRTMSNQINGYTEVMVRIRG